MIVLIRLLWTVGFLVGTTTHTMGLVAGGWLPYTYAPLWMNAYWTSLTLLDPVTAILLWTRPAYGVWLGIAVMVTDVAINSYGAYGRGYDFFYALQLQSLFGGFVLGSAPILLRRAHILAHAGEISKAARS